MPWNTPPNTLGLNLGAIEATGDDLHFVAAPADGTPVVFNSIVNLTNNTGAKIHMKLSYTDPSTGTEYSSTAHCDSGNSVFLVVPIQDPNLDIGVQFRDDASDWQAQDPAPTVSSPVELAPSNTVDVWLGEDGSPFAAPAVLPQTDGQFNLVNHTPGVLEYWLNSGDARPAPIQPGESSPVDMYSNDDQDSQWLVGFKENTDPTIVVRRPPISTGGKPPS